MRCLRANKCVARVVRCVQSVVCVACVLHTGCVVCVERALYIEYCVLCARCIQRVGYVVCVLHTEIYHNSVYPPTTAPLRLGSQNQLTPSLPPPPSAICRQCSYS